MGYVPFDDDETNAPVGFEQDPDEDELGTGTWVYADGSRRYSKGDPEDAKRLMKQEPANDAASTDESFLSSTTAAEAEDATPPPEASEAPKPLGGAMPEPAQPPQAAPQAPRGRLVPPPLPGAAGPARYSDSSQATSRDSQSTSTGSTESRTRSAQSEGDFQAQQQGIEQGYDQQAQATEQGAQGVAQAIDRRRAALEQMGRDREAVTSAAIAQRDARAMQVKQKMQEVASRKTDHNKIWKDKGALGTTLGLLGVALRSLTATKFGGPNTALQSLQEQKRQNLQAQMEDRDSELRGLERELGSLDAAIPVFEARMNDALIKRLDAMMLDEKSQQVLANGKQLKAQLETEKVKQLGEGAKAYYGTIATQQSQQSQQSTEQGQSMGRERMSGAGVGEQGRGKSGAELYDEMLERDKKMEERGATMEQRQAMWDAVGLRMPAGESAPARTNREQSEKVARDEATFTEDQAKAEAALDSLLAYGDDAGLTRDKKDDFEDPGFIAGSVKPGWAEPVTEALGRPTPVKDSRKVASQAVGRLVSGGVIGKEEGEDLLQMIGDENASRAQIASRLNRVKRLVHSRRKANRRDDPTGPRGKPINTEATDR